MEVKIKKLREVLRNAEEGIAELHIIRLQAPFKALLVKKLYETNRLEKIKVKTLANDNPDYEENQLLTIDLFDGGLIEIKILN